MSRRPGSRARGALQVLALPTLALLIVLAFLPGEAELATRLYALFLAAVVIALVLGALRRALPPPRPLPAGIGARPAAPRPSSLVRLEDEIALAADSAFDYHHRLRKRLRALAEGLLLARRRVVLDRETDAARRALGETAWELVREGRPPAEERHARGPTPAALAEAVSALERL